MRQMSLGIKFVVGGQVSSTKKKWIREKKFGELSTEEIKEITDNAVPTKTKHKKVIKLGMRIFNDTCPLSFP